jgi:hypothetical protein
MFLDESVEYFAFLKIVEMPAMLGVDDFINSCHASCDISLDHSRPVSQVNNADVMIPEYLPKPERQKWIITDPFIERIIFDVVALNSVFQFSGAGQCADDMFESVSGEIIDQVYHTVLEPAYFIKGI